MYFAPFSFPRSQSLEHIDSIENMESQKIEEAQTHTRARARDCGDNPKDSSPIALLRKKDVRTRKCIFQGGKTGTVHRDMNTSNGRVRFTRRIFLGGDPHRALTRFARKLQPNDRVCQTPSKTSKVSTMVPRRAAYNVGIVVFF